MKHVSEERVIFEMHIDEWRTTHPGKFVVIKDEIIGFYDDLGSAYAHGTRRFGLERFLVAYISPRVPAPLLNSPAP